MMNEELILRFLKPRLKSSIRSFEASLSVQMQQIQAQVEKQFVYVLVPKDQKVLVVPATIDEQGRINYKNIPVKAKYLSDILLDATKNL